MLIYNKIHIEVERECKNKLKKIKGNIITKKNALSNDSVKCLHFFKN